MEPVQPKSYSSSEKKVLLFCAVFMAVCVGVYYFGDEYLWNEGGLLSDRNKIGFVTSQENDTRHRDQGALAWHKARDRQAIHVGDSIFSGARSHSHVALNKGGGIDIGENSLVVFSEFENEKMANLMGGNFRLKVNGSLRLAINGEVVRIDGKNSEMQIYFDGKQKPHLKLLRGDAQVSPRSGPPLRFDARAIASLHPDPIPSAANAPAPQPEPTENLIYRWRLYDLYQGQDGLLVERVTPPASVAVSLNLSWGRGANVSSKIQIAKTADFMNFIERESGEPRLQLQNLFPGESFWRVSTDGGVKWSPAQRIFVQTEFMPGIQPVLPKPRLELPFAGEKSTYEVDIRSPVPSLGFVAEAALDNKFTPGQTHVFWSPGQKVKLSFYKTGSFYYRFRTVTQAQELSDWSAVQRFDVVPANSLKNRLAQRSGPKRNLKEKRHVAATSLPTRTRMKFQDAQEPWGSNVRYRDSHVAVEGYTRFLESTEQHHTEQQRVVAGGVGVRGQKWWGHQGVEGLMKSTVVKMAGPSGSAQNFEARYHYRFITGFPFGWARELQTSLFAGYETYRNDAPLYLSRYDVMKFGTSLEFPLWDRWSTGGEVAYGWGADKSVKKELSGHLYYYLTRDWSFGAGYRFHILDAGDPAATPGNYVPYREGYAEGYSILNYHF